jgi:hypothetical protein
MPYAIYHNNVNNNSTFDILYLQGFNPQFQKCKKIIFIIIKLLK